MTERNRNQSKSIQSAQGEILLYQSGEGRIKVECRFVEENLWLTQRLIADLYQKDPRTINEHLKNIYAEGELAPETTIRKFRIVRHEGSREVSREIEHFNLDVTLAVGYRVRSQRGTRFRQWATAGLELVSISYKLVPTSKLISAPAVNRRILGLMPEGFGDICS